MISQVHRSAAAGSVRYAFPARSARREAPEVLIGDQIAERRQVRRGGRQGLHHPSLPGGAADGNEQS